MFRRETSVSSSRSHHLEIERLLLVTDGAAVSMQDSMTSAVRAIKHTRGSVPTVVENNAGGRFLAAEVYPPLIKYERNLQPPRGRTAGEDHSATTT